MLVSWRGYYCRGKFDEIRVSKASINSTVWWKALGKKEFHSPNKAENLQCLVSRLDDVVFCLSIHV